MGVCTGQDVFGLAAFPELTTMTGTGALINNVINGDYCKTVVIKEYYFSNFYIDKKKEDVVYISKTFRLTPPGRNKEVPVVPRNDAVRLPPIRN